MNLMLGLDEKMSLEDTGLSYASARKVRKLRDIYNTDELRHTEIHDYRVVDLFEDGYDVAIRLARNGDFLPANAVLQPGDEIALIPPVSGG